MKAAIKLGNDIIEMYKPYENFDAKWETKIISQQTFQTPDYFEVIDVIGKGAYAIVVAARDKNAEARDKEKAQSNLQNNQQKKQEKTQHQHDVEEKEKQKQKQKVIQEGEKQPEIKKQAEDEQEEEKQAEGEAHHLVAIKKIDKAFEHRIFAKRTLRELRFLRLLKHENIIGIETLLLPRSRQTFKDIYIVSEMMDTDLTHLICNEEEPLTEEHHRFFLYQLLKGLKYIHSANIIHRDLKPRNLLVNAQCELKICDFGLARLVSNDHKVNVLTEYVATRWYRAPQLLLSAHYYTTLVDMWSVGCIFAQMLLKKALLPGKDTKHQLSLITQFLGEGDIDNMKHIPEESKKLIKYVPAFKKKGGKDFTKLFQQTPPDAYDLLRKFLTIDPEKRISAAEALNHPYLAELHEQENQPVRQPIDPIEFEFEDHNLTTQQIKDLLYEEVLLYNNAGFRSAYEAKRAKKESLIEHILKNSNASNIDPFADADDE